jgi:hypothetical protein
MAAHTAAGSGVQHTHKMVQEYRADHPKDGKLWLQIGFAG